MITTDTTDVTTISTQVAGLLAEELARRQQSAQPGHCARVDYLAPDIAQRVLDRLKQLHPDLTCAILTHEQTATPPFITTDQAIELRNRKQGAFCLFVPTTVVDAALTSLANSFEEIDGRDLYKEALKRIMQEIKPKVRAVLTFVRRKRPPASDEQQLDFAVAASDLANRGKEDTIGYELWRVNLIPNGSPTFQENLSSNFRSVQRLARPKKITATAPERIGELGVTQQTAKLLTSFFQGRSMNDVATWSRDILAYPELTFDQWGFPEEIRSDLEKVSVTPFTNPKNGRPERYTHMELSNGDSGILVAQVGKKREIVVRWECEPRRPNNLSTWRIQVVPEGSGLDITDADDNGSPDLYGEEHSSVLDQLERDVPAYRGSAPRGEAHIKLDLEIEKEEWPNYPLCVRVIPLDSAGKFILNAEDKPFYDDSEAFYLERASEEPQATARERRATTPTLAYGRIAYALDQPKTDEITPQSAQLSPTLDAFTLKLTGKGASTTLTLRLSPLLVEIERNVLANHGTGGRYRLSMAEPGQATFDMLESLALDQYKDDSAWADFWNTRRLFFERFKKGENARDLIETAEWTAERAKAAIRYAQAYRALLDELRSTSDNDTLRAALTVDTLLVQVKAAGGDDEEAVVTLPTHPLRAAWVATYTQLLAKWEDKLLQIEPRKRKHALDKELLLGLAPANTPPIAYSSLTGAPFLYSQNLLFFHGVALPAHVHDPTRRCNDLALMLTGASLEYPNEDVQPERLVEYLDRFYQLHPYIETLVTTLVNPDRGQLFADALQQWLQPPMRVGRAADDDDDIDTPNKPAHVQVAAFGEDIYQTPTRHLTNIRAPEHSGGSSDILLPHIAVTLNPLSQIETSHLHDAHLAIISDFTRPTVVAASADTQETHANCYALYGLIARLAPQFTQRDGALIWRRQLMGDAPGANEDHPAGSAFTGTLAEVQEAMLLAGGRLLSTAHHGAPLGQARPALEIRLDVQQGKMLQSLHSHSDWVISLDRFFALDYYDSPLRADLRHLADAYVLDYIPDVTEEVNHRLMVTTVWRDEINELLQQRLEEMGLAHQRQETQALLRALKSLSGRLVLQAMISQNEATQAVGLGAVAAWLAGKGRLAQSVLIPASLHPSIFSPIPARGASSLSFGADLALITLKPRTVEVEFIAVAWQWGAQPLENITTEMKERLHTSAKAFEDRFFDRDRVDGALQRAALASVIRFYFERAIRYGLIDEAVQRSFDEYLNRLEREKLIFKADYAAYVINLQSPPRDDYPDEDMRVKILASRDLQDVEGFRPYQHHIEQVVVDAEDESTLVAMEPQQATLLPVMMEPPTTILAVENVSETPDGQATPLSDEHPMEPLASGETLTAHKSSELPEADTEDEEIAVPLGEAHGFQVSWLPSVKGSPHLFIMGIPGQGKSWALLRIVSNLAEQHVPSLVLDFHGQFSQPTGVGAWSPPGTVLDASDGLPFSPFEIIKEKGVGWKANSYELAEILGHVVGLGEIQQEVVRKAIVAAYRAHGFADGDGHLADDELSYPTMREVLKQLQRLEQESGAKNAVVRCNRLLEANLFKPVEGGPDLISLARRGLIIDLHNIYGETLQLAAGAFVLQKLYKDMFRWGPAKRLRLVVTLDEAHRLARDTTLPLIMKEGRKYGVAVVVASQGMNDFQPETLGNVGAKIVFKLNYPESLQVAKLIDARRGPDIARQIERLSVGTAYIQTPEALQGVITRMFPLGDLT